jgi:hypothetical protein
MALRATPVREPVYPLAVLRLRLIARRIFHLLAASRTFEMLCWSHPRRVCPRALLH